MNIISLSLSMEIGKFEKEKSRINK